MQVLEISKAVTLLHLQLLLGSVKLSRLQTVLLRESQVIQGE